MKFSDHLAAHMTLEWKKQYVCYGTLKSILRAVEREVSLDKDPHIIQKHLRPVQEVFFQTCDRELVKVNLFYTDKLSEAQRRLAMLRVEVKAWMESQRECGHSLVHRLGHLLRAIWGATRQQAERKLKLAVSELHLSLILLQNYRELNYIGFCKIMKKYDAGFMSGQGLKWKNERLDTSPLHRGRRTCQFISEVETLMIQLEGGDKQKAMKILQVPPLGSAKPIPTWTTFRVGVTCGLLLALLGLIALRVTQAPEWAPLKPILLLYRGGFLLIEFLVLLGVNIYGWKRAGVNHVLIFELDPRDHLSHHHVFEVAGYLAVCWCASVLACLHSPLLRVPLQLHPLLSYCLPLLLLLTPTPSFHARTRHWLLSLLYRVLTTPFHSVWFADSWLADQLNSLTPLFLDLWGLFCFYTCEVNWGDPETLNAPPVGRLDCKRYNRGLICLIQCFPPWLRFAQCLRKFWDSGSAFPHLLNAGKYATVFLMVTLAGLYSTATERLAPNAETKLYLYLWAAATCLGVLATVSWDLRMDWGLLQGEGLLRGEMVYSRQAYYCAMLVDVLLRMSWGVNIILVQIRDSDSAIITGVLAPLEVFRRFIWNFFRLENEHLHNCAQLRAVRDVPLAPQTLSEHVLLERLMDQEDQAKDHQKQSTARRKPDFTIRCLR